MPIYAYCCDQCGHVCEVLQKVTDAAPACGQCGHEAMSKQVTAAAFALKGSGWYKTDFQSKGKAGGCPVAEAASAAGQVAPCAAGGCCAGSSE